MNVEERLIDVLSDDGAWGGSDWTDPVGRVSAALRRRRRRRGVGAVVGVAAVTALVTVGVLQLRAPGDEVVRPSGPAPGPVSTPTQEQQAAADALAAQQRAAAAAAAAAGKHVEQGSARLTLTLSPISGPVGTVVHIRASNCADANGQNHAVSFNPDTSNRQPDAPVRDIPASLVRQNLAAVYTITRADAHGSGQGEFFVQCATDLADQAFTITR